MQDIKRHDQGIYRCRIDFRTSQTQSFRFNLSVISKYSYSKTFLLPSLSAHLLIYNNCTAEGSVDSFDLTFHNSITFDQKHVVEVFPVKQCRLHEPVNVIVCHSAYTPQWTRVCPFPPQYNIMHNSLELSNSRNALRPFDITSPPNKPV